MSDETDRHGWIEPGAFEVAPGVHRIPLPLPNDGLRAVNVYALTDGDGLTLIDSGWALTEARQQLETALRLLGHDLAGIRRFLVTHVHRDHYTQAVVVRRLFGARVALGADERDTLQHIIDRHELLSPRQRERLAAAGAPDLIPRLLAAAPAEDSDRRDSWALPDEWLRDGDTITVGDRVLRTVATPGHTRGHVVFHDERNRLLFAGDHVLSTITPSIGLESAPGPSPLRDYLSSLDVVAAMTDTTLLPAHGPVRPSTAARVTQLQEHHRARLEEMLAAAGGGVTALDVARQVGWTRRKTPFDELDLFNQMLAVNETLAHLDVLTERGLLPVRTEDGIRLFG